MCCTETLIKSELNHILHSDMKQCIYNTQLRLVPETQSIDTRVFTKQLNLDAKPIEGVVFKHPEDHDITIKSRKPTVFS